MNLKVCFEVVGVCSRLFGAITRVTLVFHQNGDFNAAFYRLISSFSVVKLTVSVRDLNGLTTTYRKRILSIGDFAQWFSMNNLFEIFRYIINEISTNNFNCEEIPHNLTL